jgi:hypothetical protein
MNGTEQAEAMAELYTGQPAGPAADEIQEGGDRVVRVRASSWGALFDCAHRWEGIHLLGMRGKAGGRLRLGQALHASTAVYDQARVAGEAITPDDAAGALVDELHREDDEEPVDWSDLPRREAERIGLTLHTQYCTSISPRYEYRAVELQLEPLDVRVDAADVTVRLTGTMDRGRVVADQNRLTIGDLKSGQRAVGADGRAVTQGHHIQLGVYDLAAEHTLGEETSHAGEVVGLQASSKPRVGVGHIDDVRTPLVGTEDQPGLIEMAAQMFRSGSFYPNPKSVLCSPDYCPRHRQAGGDCIFHD